MLPAECQAEEHSHAIDTPAHEWARIVRREALAESIDKSKYKTQNTTEGQKCHAHGMQGRQDRIGG